MSADKHVGVFVNFLASLSQPWNLLIVFFIVILVVSIQNRRRGQ